MKIVKIISCVIYFLFTMAFGVLLALYLPNLYAIKEANNIMKESFESGDFETAMSLGGGLYDKNYVLQQDFEQGGGIVLFSAGTLIDGQIDGELIENSKMHKAYSGFIYKVKDIYKIDSNVLNKTKIVITDDEGNTHDITILDYDSDGDDKKNSVYTYEVGGYIYLDIGEEVSSTIRKIELIDKEGGVFAEIEVNLDFNETFFDDVEDFLNEYNENFKSDKLTDLRNTFLDKSEAYRQTGMKVAESRADKKATVVVVVYFVVIYVIADFLLGSHLIIKFVKWVLVKVFKVKFKQRGPKHTEVFGHDYFCKLTLSIDTESLDGFEESVQVRFQNVDGEEFAYVLVKSRNYTDTQSIKAGNYVNLWVDLNEKYMTQNLPDTIEVEGYQKTITFKILNRED